MTRMALLVLAATGCSWVGGGDSDGARTGIAALRIYEVTGPCPIELDALDHLPVVNQDLPFRRAHATASFRASDHYPGGHSIVLAYRDDEGRLGHVEVEVAPERGYGLAAIDVNMTPQATGFAEWRDGQLLFAGDTLAGYTNYYGDRTHTPMPSAPMPPDKLYGMLGFEGLDHNGARVCRIVTVHGSATESRDAAFDPSWLERRPSLLVRWENGALTPPSLADLAAPSDDEVPAADAPEDPGAPPPDLVQVSPNATDHGGGGSSPCD